jgi:hypothetical protein
MFKLIEWEKPEEGIDYILRVETAGLFSNSKFEYRGTGTVWYNHETGKRCSNGIECKLSQLYRHIKWGRVDHLRRYTYEEKAKEKLRLIKDTSPDASRAAYDVLAACLNYEKFEDPVSEADLKKHAVNYARALKAAMTA